MRPPRLICVALGLILLAAPLQAQTARLGAPELPPADDSARGGFVAGASVYVLRPYLDNNVAYTSTTGLTGTSPQSSNTNFDWKTEPAFDIWAGYNFAEGLGVRARWFHLDAYSNTMDASLTSPAVGNTIGAAPTLPTLAAPLGATLFGSPGLLLNNGVGKDVLTFTSSLRIDTVDAEATYTCGTDRWNFVFAGGGRFMTMSQAYHARLNNNPGDGVTAESQGLDFTHSFNGGGPTIDLEATWQIGRTNFSLFANTRASLLVGRSNEAISYTQVVTDPLGRSNLGGIPVNTVINPTATNYTDKVIPITEIELGLEYSRTWGRAHWFVRCGLVDQTYFGAGSSSRVDGNLSLFGGKLSIGVGY